MPGQGKEAASSAVRAAGEKRRPDAASPGPPPRRRPRVPGLPKRLSPALSAVVGAGSGVAGREGGDRERRLGREGEGAAEDRLERRLAVGAGNRSRAGRGGSSWRGEARNPRRGTRRGLPGPAGRANVTVSPAERSHPLTLTLTRTLAPTRATARSPGPRHSSPRPPGEYLQLPSA